MTNSTGANVPALVRRDGVVLVVDDEPALRDLCRRALERVGYTVLTAANGTEAIIAARAWEGAIDVLMTDLIMPGIHGLELARAIQAERPGIGVILTSGYAAEIVENPLEVTRLAHSSRSRSASRRFTWRSPGWSAATDRLRRRVPVRRR